MLVETYPSVNISFEMRFKWTEIIFYCYNFVSHISRWRPSKRRWKNRPVWQKSRQSLCWRIDGLKQRKHKQSGKETRSGSQHSPTSGSSDIYEVWCVFEFISTG